MNIKFASFFLGFLFFFVIVSWSQENIINVNSTSEELLTVQFIGQRITQIHQSVIVCDGDSRTVGFAGGITFYPYSNHLGFDSTNYVYNTATGGATLVYSEGVDCITDRAMSNVDKYYSTKYYNVIVIWAGYNDMYVHNIDENKTYSALVAYSQQRRLKGWKVIVCTEINSASAEGWIEPKRLAFNNLIRNTWSDFSDGLCDLGAAEHFNNATSYQDTTYYFDGVHLTTEGYKAVGEEIKASIIELINKPSEN